MSALVHKPANPMASMSGPPTGTSIRDYAPGSSSTTSHRTFRMNNGHGSYASPTESEFSEVNDGADCVKLWDEKQVGEWLQSINCGQYEKIFKANNVIGSNLIECDQMALKEMGIKKIGDRVRIFVSIKCLRNQAIGNHKKRNRDSMAALDRRTIYTPSSSGSPKMNHMREASQPSSANRNRYSRQIDPSTFDHSTHGGRPHSPLVGADGRRGPRYGNMSPTDSARNEHASSYSSNPNSANTISGLRPETPVTRTTHETSGKGHRHNFSDASTMGKLQPGNPHIRVITGGQTKVLDIRGCKTAEEITLNVLRKLQLPENHVKNYCFYVLDGIEADPNSCRRLSDAELLRICLDLSRVERGRLIIRKIHAGEPNMEELRKAAGISFEEQNAKHAEAIANSNFRSQQKISKLTGESWDTLKQPLSPATFNAPPRPLPGLHSVRYDSVPPPQPPTHEVKRPERTDSRRAPKPRMKNFLGARPPSELISQELTTYFPDHQKEEIERAVSMSLKRHSRLSKAASRISIASNGSFTQSLKDAPPLPNIADTWLNGGVATIARGPRPLSVSRPLSISRFNLPNVSYRDSIVSTSLQPLAEESPIEPNRKSYVSFESASDSANISVTDPDGRTASQSYYDSSGPGTDAGDSLEQQLSQAIAEDGEGPDEELDSFLKGQPFDEIKWMQGALIGQGSFGSVFLALHAVTGELMAVKQVEVPSSNSNSDIDKRKQGMVAALKREIDLLRDLQHPNIVQYYGSNSDDEHFNIFLEYVPGGSVAAMLNSYGQLQEPLIRNFVRQILNGLSYLHGRDIIHRDIKGANVLVDNKGNIKISDFGISKKVEVSALQPGSKAGHINRPSLQGSVFWMAPEVVKQTSYTLKADIWSLGCLVVEMFTGTHPFPNSSQLQAIFQIGSSSAKPTTPENASEEGKTFLARTFETDQDKRPTADELLHDPFLKQIA